MSVITYEGDIHTNYGNYNLNVLNSISTSNSLSLAEHPIRMNKAQLEAIKEKERIFALLSNPAADLESAINLRPGSLIGVAQQINKLYQTAVDDAKKKMISAILTDRMTLEKLEETPQYKGFLGDARTVFMDFLICWAWKPCTFATYRFNTQASAARYACLVEIGVTEEIRVKTTIEKISARIEVLFEDLQGLKQQGQTDAKKLQELAQLEKILKFVANQNFRADIQRYLDDGRRQYPNLLLGALV